MRVAKEDEIQLMYERNLSLLTPWLRETVQKISEEEFKKRITVTYNTEGYPVCLYHKDGVTFHITGEQPLQEAAAWYSSVRQVGSAEIFLYGTGFGYPLFEIFAKKASHTLVIAFEEDIFLFKAMLYYFDLSPIIQTQKIIFILGDSSYFKEAFEELFFSMLFFSTTYPTMAFSLPSVRHFKKEYLEIHRYVFRELSLLTSYLGNDHNDNMVGLQNMMANTPEVLREPYVSCLKEKYRGYPAFIISNGPSLDRSLQTLKEIKGRGLIICVESAIVPMTTNEIDPDILAVVERTKYTYIYHFEGRHYSPEISLISLAMADPRVFATFPGEKIPVFRMGEELNHWFDQNLSNGETLDAGGNVSHLALNIAMYLGADPIILVGQDYAYGDAGVTHSKDAVASQEKGKRARDILHSLPTVYVEGNNGQKILSNSLWDGFRLGMEHIIYGHPEHHIYNATDGGAKIAGTERAELRQMIERYCTNPLPYRVNQVIAENKNEVSALVRKARLENFITEVEQNAALFRNLAHELNLKKLDCERMMFLCMEDDTEQCHDILNDTYQKNIASFYQYANNDLCRCFFQQLNCAYFHLLDRIGLIKSKDEILQAFDIQRQFFHDLRVVSQSLSIVFEKSADSLQAALTTWNEKEVEKA